MRPTSAEAEAAMRAWVERAVIGLGLCPFAAGPQARGGVRYAVSDAADTDALLLDLQTELRLLAATPAPVIETILLVHPHVLMDFDDYNAFLDVADMALAQAGLVGVLQIASFHPAYRFAGTEPGDVTNATNQAPWPTLHLLREASVERAVAAFGDTDRVVERNLQTMRALGPLGWTALQAAWHPAGDALR